MASLQVLGHLPVGWFPSKLVVSPAATDRSDFFTDKPDFAPYNALPVDPRVLDPQRLLRPFDKKIDWKSLLESPGLDNVEDFLKSRN